MKYIIVLADGMADYPIGSLGNKTPVELAKKAAINSILPKSVIGLVRTVPKGMVPGSDVANLSILGYDPLKFYTGRSPIEAVGMGIDIDKSDLAVRCNLVTLSENEYYDKKIMLDFCAGGIETEEAKELIEFINKKLGNEIYHFYAGISYRHCLLVKNLKANLCCAPPHDIVDKCIFGYLPKDKTFLELMAKSYELLKAHPINKERKAKGLKAANSIWLWGEGRLKPVKSFYEKYKLCGTVVSGVDLIKGIGIMAGLNVPNVKGATATLNTDYTAKLNVGLDALLNKNEDFLYMHLEAPDECAHRGDLTGKILAIEKIDALIIKPLIENLGKSTEDFTLLFLPDHPTPVSIKTHTDDPVPFLLYRSDTDYKQKLADYSEKSAKESGIYLEEAHTLIDKMLDSEFMWR